MSTSVSTFLDAALVLPPEERLAIATVLLDSVEGHGGEAWQRAWLVEVEARDAAGEDGTLPWREVRRRVVRRLADQAE
jgi:hypothetical protein